MARLSAEQRRATWKYLNARLGSFPMIELVDYTIEREGLTPLAIQIPQINQKREGLETMGEVARQVGEFKVDGGTKLLCETEIWWIMLLYFPTFTRRIPGRRARGKGGGNKFMEKAQGAITVKFKIPSHKQFVERQWKRLIENAVCKYSSERLSSFNHDMWRILRNHIWSSEDLDFEQALEAQHTTYVNQSVFEAVRTSSEILLGQMLTTVGGGSFRTLIDYEETILHFVPDLGILRLPKHGNIIVGEVKRTSLRTWVEDLRKCNYTIIINLADDTNPNPTLKKGQVTSFNQVIAYQILGKCKIGYLTDGFFHIFTTITDINRRSMKIVVDVTTGTTSYNEKPDRYPPVPLMMAKIAEIQEMKPQDYIREIESFFSHAENWARNRYLNFFFDGTMSMKNFEWFRRQMPNVGQEEPVHVYYQQDKSHVMEMRPGLYFQLFRVPKGVIRGYIPVDDMPDTDVVAQVYDCNMYYIANHDYVRGYDEVKENQMGWYKDDREGYQKALVYPQINKVPRVHAGFCCFWKGEEPDQPDRQSPTIHDASAYIASGLTVLRPTLRKPTSHADFLKGLKQLLILKEADVEVGVAYDNMFMSGSKFTFFRYCTPFTRPNSELDECNPDEFTQQVRESLELSSDFKDFLAVWHNHDCQLGVNDIVAKMKRYKEEIGELRPVDGTI